MRIVPVYQASVVGHLILMRTVPPALSVALRFAGAEGVTEAASAITALAPSITETAMSGVVAAANSSAPPGWCANTCNVDSTWPAVASTENQSNPSAVADEHSPK